MRSETGDVVLPKTLVLNSVPVEILGTMTNAPGTTLSTDEDPSGACPSSPAEALAIAPTAAASSALQARRAIELARPRQRPALPMSWGAPCARVKINAQLSRL